MEALRDYGQWRGREEDRDFNGMVIPMQRILFRRGQPERLRSKMGEILLCRQWIGASVVAHEDLHAALATLRMVLDDDREFHFGDDEDRGLLKEERLCCMLGSIDRQVVQGFYDHGIYP